MSENFVSLSSWCLKTGNEPCGVLNGLLVGLILIGAPENLA